MELLLPVVGHATRGSGHGLIDRVVLRLRQLGALAELIARVVVEPVLSGLEAPNDQMAGGGRMAAGVLRGRRVAATDVAATRASSQVEPPAVGGKALDAAGTTRWNRRIDVVRVGCGSARRHFHPTMLLGHSLDPRHRADTSRCPSLSG
jgi:hypothetical protein